MTKEEMIEHWADIAAAVFKAEDAIKNAGKTTKELIADAYLRAIATEILDNTNWQMEE